MVRAAGCRARCPRKLSCAIPLLITRCVASRLIRRRNSAGASGRQLPQWRRAWQWAGSAVVGLALLVGQSTGMTVSCRAEAWDSTSSVLVAAALAQPRPQGYPGCARPPLALAIRQSCCATFARFFVPRRTESGFRHASERTSMTAHRDLKNIIRDSPEKTGRVYTAARLHVLQASRIARRGGRAAAPNGGPQAARPPFSR